MYLVFDYFVIVLLTVNLIIYSDELCKIHSLRYDNRPQIYVIFYFQIDNPEFVSAITDITLAYREFK